MPQLSDFKATTIDGDIQSLEAYAGQVVLVVNTASQCGFTPQFEGLEQLHREYGDRAKPVRAGLYLTDALPVEPVS